MDRKAIKAKAKEFAFKNKWNIWKPALAYGLIVFVSVFVLTFVLALFGVELTQDVSDLIQSVIELATLPMAIGYIAYIMKLIKGEKMTVKEALTCKYNIFALIFIVGLLVGIFTALWTLLLIVPGIIYAYKMVMVDYILAEDDAKNMTRKEIMERSEKLMDGHKMEYFVFELSFIGWYLLSIVTFGIGFIWTIPYVNVATVMYYEELKKLAN